MIRDAFEIPEAKMFRESFQLCLEDLFREHSVDKGDLIKVKYVNNRLMCFVYEPENEE